MESTGRGVSLVNDPVPKGRAVGRGGMERAEVAGGAGGQARMELPVMAAGPPETLARGRSSLPEAVIRRGRPTRSTKGCLTLLFDVRRAAHFDCIH